MNKTLLAVLICVILGIAAAIGGSVWWWKSHADEIMGAMDVAVKAGQKEGADLDEAGCVAAAATRNREPANQGLIASTRNGISLSACLHVSRPTAGFCTDVPSARNPFDAAAWAQQSCSKLGLSDPYCQSLMQQVTTYCGSPARDAKLGNDSTPPAGKGVRT